MDPPALISRVLLETGFAKLGLVCHSRGTTETFVALAKAATRPWRRDQCLLCFSSRGLCWTVDWKDVLQIYVYHFSEHVSDILRHPHLCTTDDDDAPATTGRFVWRIGLLCPLSCSIGLMTDGKWIRVIECFNFRQFMSALKA
jgi:hypothetical protein